MLLSFAKLNQMYRVKKITGNDSVRNHLRNIGIVEDSYIKVVQEINGNMILMVQKARVALDSSLVRRIIVE